MVKNTLFQPGCTVSALGLGGMRFPENDGVIDFDASKKIVDRAYRSGVNYFDTAWFYHNGQSESFFAEALGEYPRDSYYIADKMPVWLCENEQDVARIFDEQLNRLQTEYIDFYLIHSLDQGNWEKSLQLHVVEFLKQKQRKGKIRFLGFSFHDTPAVLQTIVDANDWDFAQIQLNYFDWDYQHADEQYRILTERQIPVAVMEPVHGGMLANFDDSINQLFQNARPQSSVASWAIRFVASLPNVFVVLSGMSSLAQVQDNIDTLTQFEPLSQEDRQIIEQALVQYKRVNSLPCTGCRYCMDCPLGVDIPAVFAAYNQVKLTKNTAAFLACYQQLAREEKDAARCISCGRCKIHCPQHIDIPDALHEIDRFKEEQPV